MANLPVTSPWRIPAVATPRPYLAQLAKPRAVSPMYCVGANVQQVDRGSGSSTHVTCLYVVTYLPCHMGFSQPLVPCRADSYIVRGNRH